MTKKTVSILIPALNEEKNILNLLTDISKQNTGDNFILETVLVISDGSTDKTNEIVSKFSLTNPKVKLVINEKRIGKIFSVGKGYSILNSDYIVMFDADIRLDEQTLAELLKEVKSDDLVKLVGGNPVPNKQAGFFNIAEQASMFSWLLVQSIKKVQPKSIYSAHGRILLLSKELYKKIDIKTLSTPGDDQFIYLHAKDSFNYAKNAIVYYKLPSKIQDYLTQNLRFRKAQKIRIESEINLKKVFYIKNKIFLILKTSIMNPIKFFLWTALYFTGLLMFKFEEIFGSKRDKWGIAKSTK